MAFKYVYFLLVITLFDASFSKSTSHFGGYYDSDNAEELFQEFISTHGKNYAHGEYDTRFNIFKTNLERINELNKRHAGQHTHGITSLTDMTPEEVIATKTGFKLSNDIKYASKDEFFANMSLNVPDSFDWRTKNILNPAKDQASCGSCWAFSSIAGIESRYALTKKVLLSLSEQQLVDCSSSPDNGCNGGYMGVAYEYLKKAGGSESEAAYPYTSGNTNEAGQCAFDPSKAQVKVTEHVEINDATEEQLKSLVVEYGAVPMAFHAYGNLYTYTGGIARPTAEDCPSDIQINHAVNIVGYGEESGVKYWIIRNSWGANWGENGYLKLEIGKCLVGKYVSTAQVA